MNPPAYIDLLSSCAKIDKRNTRYRFDLDGDIPWERTAEAGDYFGPGYLATFGIDADGLRARPAAHDLVQWSLALATCEGFHSLESLIIRFLEREKAALGPSKSVEMLEVEEEKHVRLFRRYADLLRAQRPAAVVERFDRHFAPSAALLGHLDPREKFPSVTAYHYIFWLHTLFFEEYTIYVQMRLAEAPSGLQPAWLAAHEAHRREEAQHVVTDATHLAALNLGERDRHTWSRLFFERIAAHADRFFGVEAARLLLRDEDPALAAALVPERPLERLPFRDDLLFSPAFRHARKAAPYLQELARAAGVPAAAPAAPPLSHLVGPPLAAPPEPGRTLQQCLGRAAAAARAGAGIVHVREDGTERAESYEELLERAEIALAGLRAHGARRRDPVLLLLGGAEDFTAAFWGCLAGGFIPVPLGVPQTLDTLGDDVRKVTAIHDLLGDPLVVADKLVRQFLERLDPAHARHFRMVTPEELTAGGARDDRWERLPPLDDVAFIQFSSGSTGSPKGIVLTHQGVLSNLQAAIERQRVTRDDVFVDWMPLYHDMGLMGFHVTPILAGAKQVLIGPRHFAKSPLVWLEKLSEHRGTISASPTFGLSRLVHALRGGVATGAAGAAAAAAAVAGLDLRPVRCILCGAEPISVPVVQAFLEALEPAGLRSSALVPAYGLAEATVAVAFGLPDERPRAHAFDRTTLDSDEGAERVDPDHPNAIVFVDEGPPVPGVEVRIVDAEDRVVAPGVVGRIQVRGPSLLARYHGDDEATRTVLTEDGWLRTGDLGLATGGRLCVTGREKDIIFVNGRNYYAHDLEAAALEVEGTRPGRVAVIGSHDPETGGDRVIVFAHVKPSPLEDEVDVLVRLARHLNEAIGFPVDHVLPVHPEDFPRTTSGKLERYKLRQRYERGDLDALIARVEALLEERGHKAAEWRAVDRRAGERRRGERRRRPRGTPDRRQGERRGGGAGRGAGEGAGEGTGAGEGKGAGKGKGAEEGTAGAGRGTGEGAGTSESLVREVWAAVLKRDPESIDLDDSFLAIGGDSIRAAEVQGALERRLGVSLPSSILFECRTVREMAAFISRSPTPPTPAPLPLPSPAPAPPPAPAPRLRLDSSDVAVIAMIGRFPGAATIDELWELLASGRTAIGPAPPDRRAAIPFVGGFLDDLRGFDPAAFGLSDREALEMEPQQRLFLELAADLLAPWLGAGRAGREIGVFAGAGGNQYLQQYATDPARIEAATALGNLANMVAARVSQVLGLRGPALTINAACASSLVAVHMACRSLLAGECELAVAGGVELHPTAIAFHLFERAGVLSPSGRCLPYDRDASGFVLGEGAGAVLLRPLDAALAAGDPILGVIKSSALNNDGGSLSGMAPSPAGQADVLRRAYAAAGIDPATVTYIEGHGAGTPIGDAVEVRALSQVFDAATDRKGFCGLGSIKGNLGHLFSAAGIASLIKVLLALEHRALPPTPGGTPDERIGPSTSLGTGFEGTPFFPVRRRTPWEPPGGAPRRAGVSGFGVGGTNCHVVVEEAPASAAAAPAPAARECELLCLSAPTDRDLARVADRLRRHVLAHPGLPLGELCAAANAVATRFETRRALAVESVAHAVEALAAVAGGRRAAARPKVCFVFSGPGSQHAGMGRHLLETEPAFREAIGACAAILAPHLARPLETYLFGDADPLAPELDRIDVVQPVLFALEYALARWLRSLGVEPDAVLGHSAGEYVAACVAGALTLEQALGLVVRRGACMAATEPGKMAAVFAPEARVRAHLRGFEEDAAIAAVNAPAQVVLSGRRAAVDRVLEALHREGIAFHEIAVSCAAHSPLMRPAAAALAPHVGSVAARAPAVPFFSTLRGERLETAPDAAHWLEHLQAPVRFAAAVEAASRAGCGAFVEIGPGGALSTCIAEALGPEALAVSILRRNGGWLGTAEALGALFEAGVLDPRALARGGRRPRIRLPGYPYDRRPIWKTAAPSSPVRPERGPEAAESKDLDLASHPAVRDHRVEGVPIAPAALLVDLALAAARARAPATAGVRDVVIGRPLAASPGGRRAVRVRLEPAGPGSADLGAVVESRADGAGAPFEEHLACRVVAGGPGMAPPVLDLHAIARACPEEIDVAAIYDHLARNGLEYGPSMRGLRSVRVGRGEVLAHLAPPCPTAGPTPPALDPALVDSALQSIGALSLRAAAAPGVPFLGFAIGEVRAFAPVAGPCVAHVRLRSALEPGAESIRADVAIADPAGRVLARLDEVCLKRRRPPSAPKLYAVEWEEAPLASASPLAPSEPRGAGRVEGPLVLGTAERPYPADPEAWRALASRLPAPPRLVCLEPRLPDLLHLAHALQARAVRDVADLLVVASEPAVLAFLRVLGQEEPGWRCRGIEVEPGSALAHLFAGRVAAELAAPDPGRFLVAYRGGRRLAPRLVPRTVPGGGPRLRGAPPPEPPGRSAGQGTAFDPGAPPVHARLRERGVYWIAGGQGGIGLEIAAALAREARARLLLTGRRPRPEPAAVERLEALGAEVLYVPADVTDVAAMRGAAGAALERFGALHGAVHAAGVLDDGLVASRTPERMRAVLAPKVDGARILAEVTAGLGLDFLVFCSSLAALVGGPGQADYAAANASLDGLARRLERAISIDWGPWGEVGMVADRRYRERFEAQGFVPISPFAGARAFLDALTLGEPQVAIVDLDPSREHVLLSAFNSLTPSPSPSPLPTPAPAPAPAPSPSPAPPPTPLPAVRDFLRSTLAASLRRRPEDLDLATPFSRLGVDSLAAVSLVRAVESRYGLRLYPTLLFEHPTLEAAAAQIEKELAAARPPARE